MNTDEILNGAKKALIDKSYDAAIDLKPTLIFNNSSSNVLSFIEAQLKECDEFKFSTAFITEGGIQPLLLIFEELDEKGIKGKILTTDYLYYTEPSAVEKLNSFENIAVKIFKGKFHTKGYLFSKNGIHTGIVGSSNLTEYALSVTKEWNIGFTSTFDGELLESLYNEFEELWNSENTVFADDYLPEYKVLLPVLERRFREESQGILKEYLRYRQSSSGLNKSLCMELPSGE